MKRLIAAICLGGAVTLAHAEKAEKFGTVEIHYNAITTDTLLPEVARAYKIERSKSRGLATISVLKKNAVGVPTPVAARLKVHVTNLNQQLAEVPMREVREGNAVYYLGEFRIAPPDTLAFTASVETEGEPRREIRFSQSFYK
jgi:hypothetical protein